MARSSSGSLPLPNRSGIGLVNRPNEHDEQSNEHAVSNSWVENPEKSAVLLPLLLWSRGPGRGGRLLAPLRRLLERAGVRASFFPMESFRRKRRGRGGGLLNLPGFTLI